MCVWNPQHLTEEVNTAVMHVTCIREALDSNRGWKIGYVDSVQGSPQPLQEKHQDCFLLIVA